MDNKSIFNTMDDIMDGVTQTEEWANIQLHDPLILSAEEKMGSLMEEVKEYIPRELFNRISDSFYSVISAHEDAGILYGVRISNILREISENPLAFRQHVLGRLKKDESVESEVA